MRSCDACGTELPGEDLCGPCASYTRRWDTTPDDPFEVPLFHRFPEPNQCVECQRRDGRGRPPVCTECWHRFYDEETT